LAIVPCEAGFAERLKDYRPEVFFHLAAHTDRTRAAENTQKIFAGNVLFPVTVLEAALAAGCRALVNTGTHFQHRDGTSAYVPTDLYAASKQAFEDVLAAYVEYDQLRAVSLKLSDVYGPGDPRNRIVSLLIAAQASGSPIELSPGHQQIDLVHVDDVVRAFVMAGEALWRGSVLDKSYAVQSGRLLTLRALADLVAKVGRRPIDARWGAKPYRPGTIMHPWRGPRLPGWQPSVSLEEGVRALIAEQAAAKVALPARALQTAT
jgi:nucleoside-diphosphate-sugar epimerase